MQGLGNTLNVLVQKAGNIQGNPSDPFAKKELSDNAKHVAEKVCMTLLMLCTRAAPREYRTFNVHLVTAFS